MKNLEVLVVAIFVLGAALCLPSALQAAWVGNDCEQGLKSADGNGSRVESFIIDGASAFLLSQADIFLLLNESEIGLKNGFNLEQALQLVDSARAKLMVSEENYSQALGLIRTTVIAEVWQQRLKNFDYERLIAVRHLHPEVMNRVAAFLVRGDAAGLYRQMLDLLGEMSANLDKMRKRMQKGILPGMESLRTLYQQYADFMLVGYYTSLVFSEVKTL